MRYALSIGLLLTACEDETIRGEDLGPRADGGADAFVLPCEPLTGTPDLTLQLVADGLEQPVAIQSPPGDSRLFVVEQVGRIRIIDESGLRESPFLDLTGGISLGNEQGLLGLAFHPDYAANGRFFVNYTDMLGDTRIVEFAASDDANTADPVESLVLSVDQPYPNHNGGGLAFGPDGFLYVGLGDGGSGCDPEDRAQTTSTLLGKMLRLDVDAASPYAIPTTNPFNGSLSVANEIWALGLRNPWRFSFDRETGDLYIADVGQDEWEEINLQPAASTGGENYGWRDFEADVCQDGATGTSCGGASSCDPSGRAFPVHAYGHGPTLNCFGPGGSVSGGYVYRGCLMPAYHGTYFYADYCFGTVHSLEASGGVATNLRDWPSLDATVSSFGQDSQGELYIADHAAGAVYRIAPE